MTRGLPELKAFVDRHWVTAAYLPAGVVLGAVVGYGFAQRWGASQWGPFAEWFAGVATFGAVVQALRESARGQRARRVDHELTRRRESLKAVNDVWAAIVKIGMDFNGLKEYFDDLPLWFDAAKTRSGFAAVPPAEALGEEIRNRITAFYTKWIELVEPSLFYARALLQDTPMDAEIKEISGDIKKINNIIFPEILNTCISTQGQRPDITRFHAPEVNRIHHPDELLHPNDKGEA